MSSAGLGRVLQLPPRVKVLEAAGAIADGRVRVVRRRNGLTVARVSSSLGDREYTVVVKRANGRVFRVYSDDNGTRFRNYAGYPIVAVLMLEGVLPRSRRVEQAVKGTTWRVLNEQHKNYRKVEEVVAASAESRGFTREELDSYIKEVLSMLSEIRLIYDPLLAMEARQRR